MSPLPEPIPADALAAGALLKARKRDLSYLVPMLVERGREQVCLHEQQGRTYTNQRFRNDRDPCVPANAVRLRQAQSTRQYTSLPNDAADHSSRSTLRRHL